MVKRIIEAIEKIEKNDFENALIQISIGIDGIAKLKYPGLRTTERCIKLVEEYRDFIYRFSTLGKVSIGVNGNIKYAGEFEGKSLGEIVYKVIRCELLHEGKLPDDKSLVFGNNFGIGGIRLAIENSKTEDLGFLISKGLLLSLCFILIENDNSNEYKELNGFKEFVFGEKSIRIDRELWTENKLTEKILNNLKI